MDTGDSTECIDLDRYLFMIVEEYVEHRRRILNSLKFNFNKRFDTDKGYFSCEDFRSIINSIIDHSLERDDYKFPRNVIIDRSFIYALTAHKNGLDITLRSFIGACHRYGIDSPFPPVFNSHGHGHGGHPPRVPSEQGNSSMLGDNLKLGKIGNEAKSSNTIQKKKILGSDRKDPTDRKSFTGGEDGHRGPAGSVRDAGVRRGSMFRSVMPDLGIGESQRNLKTADGDAELDEELIQRGIRIDTTSKLLAQHFSILRELKFYLNKFKQNMKENASEESVRENLELLEQVLDAGCHFLKFPVIKT